LVTSIGDGLMASPQDPVGLALRLEALARRAVAFVDA